MVHQSNNLLLRVFSSARKFSTSAYHLNSSALPYTQSGNSNWLDGLDVDALEALGTKSTIDPGKVVERLRHGLSADGNATIIPTWFDENDFDYSFDGVLGMGDVDAVIILVINSAPLFGRGLCIMRISANIDRCSN